MTPKYKLSSFSFLYENNILPVLEKIACPSYIIPSGNLTEYIEEGL